MWSVYGLYNVSATMFESAFLQLKRSVTGTLKERGENNCPTLSAVAECTVQEAEM